MREVPQEITTLIVELFPHQIYKGGRLRRYNRDYGYELSRQFIDIIVQFNSLKELKDYISGLMVYYPDSDNDILTLLAYKIYLEPTIDESIEPELSWEYIAERIK